MILTDYIAVYICDHQEKLNKHGNLVFQKN